VIEVDEEVNQEMEFVFEGPFIAEEHVFID